MTMHYAKRFGSLGFAIVVAFYLGACRQLSSAASEVSPALTETQRVPTEAPNRADRPAGTVPLGAERVQMPELTASTGEVPEDLLDLVIADLLGRLSAGAPDIELLRAESVVWNDGSLGCSKPGEMYTQAPIQGYWIVLATLGSEYDYRASETGFFLLCEQDFDLGPGIPGGTPSK